jgi:hypothetical protein
VAAERAWRLAGALIRLIDLVLALAPPQPALWTTRTNVVGLVQH